MFFCYMINLHNSVTIFACIYLLEHFATFNMGVPVCVCVCVHVHMWVLVWEFVHLYYNYIM